MGLKRIDSLRNSHTVPLIFHNMENAAIADTIVVLDGGRVAGTKDPPGTTLK